MKEWTKKNFEEFGGTLKIVMSFYGDTPDAQTIALWAKVVAPHLTADQAVTALEMYLTTERASYKPKPADIIGLVVGPVLDPLERIRAAHPDGNIAWSIACRAEDEAETLVWTEEMFSAWQQAKQSRGGDVAQRMAFLAIYKSLVEASAVARRVPVWKITYGFNRALRAARVDEAARMGLIQAESLSHSDRVMIGKDTVKKQGLMLVAGTAFAPAHSQGDSEKYDAPPSDQEGSSEHWDWARHSKAENAARCTVIADVARTAAMERWAAERKNRRAAEEDKRQSTLQKLRDAAQA